MASKPTYEELEKRVADLERELRRRTKQEPPSCENKSLFSIICDNLNEFIYVSDPKTYEILYANKHIREALGKDPIGGKCYEEFLHFDKPCDVCINKTILNKNGKPHKWEHHNSRFKRSFMVSDCMIKWPDGRDVKLGIALDISERIRAEKNLQKSRDNYRNRLEGSVAERTMELEKVNKELQREITERRQVEDRLLRIGKAVESVADAIGLTDTEGRIFYQNRASRKLFGYNTPEEMEAAGGGLKLFADPGIAYDAFDIIGNEGSWSDEIEAVNRNGQRFPAFMRVSAVKDSEGNITGFFGVASDISERRKAEKALQESEERFRALAETSSDFIWQTDHEGNFTYASPKVERLLGYAPGEVIGKTAYDLMPEEERKRIAEILRPNIEKQLPFEILENTNIHKAGHHLIVETSGVPIFNPEGVLVGWIGLARDITERKRAEDAIRRSEERLTNVRRAVNEGIWEWDVSKDEVTYVSDRFTEIMGFGTGTSFSFENWSERVHPDHGDKVLEALWKTVRGESVFDIEFKYSSNGGEYVWLNATGMLVNKGERENKTMVGSVRDITERKLAEREKRELHFQLQQAQKMEALGRLAGGIAHDFNNLLQSVIVNTELGLYELEEKGIDTRRLQQILKASQRAKELVKQIVTFSRQREKKQSPLKLTPLVKEALKLLRSTLPATIEVRQNIRAKKDTILADPTQINQIIMNLCTNAAHAMQQKGGVLEVGLVDVEFYYDATDVDADITPGKYVIMTVSDTGHGMDQAVLERIFDPFFSTKKPGEGTGLGLSVVHGIVKACRGTIIVDSEPGKGATFQIFLPRVEDDVETISENAPPLSRGNERILLIDDEKMIIDSLRPALENLGYAVVSRTNGMEALKAFQKEPEHFDLVITDQTMPHMTGSELAKRLMSIRPDIPIIICTGFSDLISPKDAKAMGIREFLVKPIVTNEISTAIRRVLDMR